ncbi:hypothetical protein E3N88_40695 [Mikania micrantha]|uniref:Uncharacterized protein n=1 Tax=Mikania micrantha TaxID=192012 RepID=A0A5N6LQP6_9ASTR|nr:hypothetical protein E3N88_40695 [Mikania micrantha]
MEEGDDLRTRSFRDEDYTIRRVFLTSYPLHFDNDDIYQETPMHTTATPNSNRFDAGVLSHVGNKKKENMKLKLKMKMKKEEMKNIIVEWVGGRVTILRRFQCKVSFYVFACFPVSFKPHKPLIS